jgi:hypothetical protein
VLRARGGGGEDNEEQIHRGGLGRVEVLGYGLIRLDLRDL